MCVFKETHAEGAEGLAQAVEELQRQLAADRRKRPEELAGLREELAASFEKDH